MIKLGRLSNQWPFRRGFVPSISLEELRGLYTTYDIQNYLGPTFYLRCIHNHVLKTLEEILRSEPWSFIHLALWWLCLTFTLIYFCLFICKSSQLFQQSHQECGQDYTRWSWKVLPHWSLHIGDLLIEIKTWLSISLWVVKIFSKFVQHRRFKS